MFCQKCGNEVIEDAVVCPACGCAICEITKKTVEENSATGNSAE